MGQISLRQVIYIVIGFAIFFTCVTLALSGSQFFQVISVAGAATIPVFLFYAMVYAFCRAISLIVSGGSPPSTVASQAPAGTASRVIPPVPNATREEFANEETENTSE